MAMVRQKSQRGGARPVLLQGVMPLGSFPSRPTPGDSAEMPVFEDSAAAFAQAGRIP
jgi:hypothetical protein